MTTTIDPPTLDEVRATRVRLGDRIVVTPTRRLEGDDVERAVGSTIVLVKEELFQRTGSFKLRGALNTMMALAPDVRARGVTCASAGNHAIATAFAARAMGTTAKVVMPSSANPARVAKCRALGGEVVLVENIGEVFARALAIERDEGRTFVHPFEGPRIVEATATIALEILEQATDVDAVIVPIGGGGLCAGIASAMKQAAPRVQVFGVEPIGADAMARSFAAGEPRSIEAVKSIADSLGAPKTAPYTFALCRRFLDDLVLVDDDAIRAAMRVYFDVAKLAVEPAAAASFAALCGPLRDRVAGKRVCVVASGTNIDPATFARHLGAAYS
jgi:threonine dehydratase